MTTIEGYDNYVIFEDGVVMNTKFSREIKPKLETNGYYRICLFKNGKQKYFSAHRLIALAFIPNPNNKPLVDHINRNTQDNRIENLRWATYKENTQNQKCYSNTGLHFISKRIDKKLKQGFNYRFQINRPELKHHFYNGDLEVIKEYRNKFCLENNIEFNDKL